MGEDLERRYRESLRRRLAALNAARPGVHRGDPEAIASVRRVAHVLKGSGASFGHPRITELGEAVEEAEDAELPDVLDACIDHLAEVVEVDSPAPSGTVLVVEDDPTQALLIRSALETGRHTVVVASTGAEATRLLEEHTVVAVVLDLILPDTDGREMLMRLQERPETASIPVVVVTASASELTRTECRTLGADAVFEKPVDVEVLRATLDSRMRIAARTESQATRDPVSGLLNRAGFLDSFRDRATVHGGALVVLEVDGFSSVRRRLGRSGAERVLGRVGDVVGKTMTECRALGRLEGSTFVALCGDAVPEEVARTARDALEALRRVEMQDQDGEPFRVTASAALVPLDHDRDMDLDEALDRAQGLLLSAQKEGGNRLVTPGEGEEGPSDDRSVLIAEDDELTAALLRHRLEREGFRVHHYDDGIDAYEAALDHEFSLVILDVRMPGMDGFEVLERLRKTPAYEDVPVLFLTAMGSEDDLERGFALGADDYMLKPFSPTELLARVRRLLTHGVHAGE